MTSDLLASDVPLFARVRIETGHDDARARDAEVLAQGIVHDMRTLASTRSRVSARGTAESGTCTVNGTTRSSSLTSIITGNHAVRAAGAWQGRPETRYGRNGRSPTHRASPWRSDWSRRRDARSAHDVGDGSSIDAMMAGALAGIGPSGATTGAASGIVTHRQRRCKKTRQRGRGSAVGGSGTAKPSSAGPLCHGLRLGIQARTAARPRPGASARLQGDVEADSCRIAHRQGERPVSRGVARFAAAMAKAHAQSRHLYSIIASWRRSRR